MKERNYGIDLLRIVSMVMIVLMHVLSFGGILWDGENFSASYYICWCFEALSVCAVNCYAMISGYVGYGKPTRISKLLQIWLQVLFYGVIALLVFGIMDLDKWNATNLKQTFMPVTMGKYWYISAYFGLFLLKPVLHGAVDKMSRKSLLAALLGVYAVFTIVPTAFDQNPFGLSYGYSVLWLSILYLTGAYLKKYEVASKIKTRKVLCIWAGSVAIIFLGKTIGELLTNRIFGEPRYGNLFMYYTSPFVVVIALCMVLLFARIRMESGNMQKAVCILSSATLGVYLIHLEPFVLEELLRGCTSFLADYNVILMALIVFGIALGIYLACTILELVRIKLFEVIRIHKLCDKAETIIQKSFDKFCEKHGIE